MYVLLQVLLKDFWLDETLFNEPMLHFDIWLASGRCHANFLLAEERLIGWSV